MTSEITLARASRYFRLMMTRPGEYAVQAIGSGRMATPEATAQAEHETLARRRRHIAETIRRHRKQAA